MNFNVLTINTYGGSLLLAAKMAGLPIVASFEDAGFGSDIQALNFPGVPLFLDKRDWPRTGIDLNETIVLAHPPCAAFSNQNKSIAARGTEAGSFRCHVDVLEYALPRDCAALAIESVQGALSAARDVYAQHAQKYGYNHFFILQNAVSFGVPQWRPRFWVLFMKKDCFFTVHPNFKVNTVKKALWSFTDQSRTDPGTTARRIRSRPGLFKALNEADSAWKGPILSILEKKHNLPREENFANVREMYGLTGLFTTCLPRFVDADDFTTTILEDSWWFYGKRELTVEEYCGIMGFPRDYKWGQQLLHFRKFLSKGICPPVGAWIIKQLVDNLEGSITDAAYIDSGEVWEIPADREKLLKERAR